MDRSLFKKIGGIFALLLILGLAFTLLTSFLSIAGVIPEDEVGASIGLAEFKYYLDKTDPRIKELKSLYLYDENAGDFFPGSYYLNYANHYGDLNALDDTNFTNIGFTGGLFGDGSNLTGISSIDTNWQTTPDFNEMFQSVFERVNGIYLGSTSVSHVPNLTYGTTAGYVAANALCDLNYSNSHLCTIDEMIASIRLSINVVWTGTSWAAEGAPGYTANANDCAGYTSSNGAHLASFWNFDANKSSLTACNGSKPLACCR